MKKRKDTTVLLIGALAIAALVAVLMLAWDGDTPAAEVVNTGATTTPQQLAPVVVAPAAKPMAAPVDNSVRGVASRLSGTRTFTSLLDSTGVGASLSGAGPYTVFVPSDTAFGQMGSNFLSLMSATQKKRLAQYHVIAGKALDLDAVSSGNHAALSKDLLNFNVKLESMVAYVNSGYSISQHKASNGIVYVISSVLVPPQTANSSTGSTGTPTPR